MDKKHCWSAQLLVTLLVLNEMNWTHASIGWFIIAELYHLSCAIARTINVLFTSHLNCKYHSWRLINDMQMSIYNRKQWHALPHSLHFVRPEGGLATDPPSPAIKSGSRLSIFDSVCLGLVPGQIVDSPCLIITSWITIPRDEYYTVLS